MKSIKIGLLLISLQIMTSYGYAELENKSKADAKKNFKAFLIEKTIFVNGRVNNIWLTVTYGKNEQFQKMLKIGEKFEYHHKPEIVQKVVCSEKHGSNATLTKADLDTYSVFVFNTDQKTDKYHFINIHQRHEAVKRARHRKYTSLMNDLSEQTIYNP